MKGRMQTGLALALVFLILLMSDSFCLAADKLDFYGTIKRGVIIAAMNGDMPMTKLDKNGELIGTDGEILVEIAKNLGLKVEPLRMDWSGTVPSVQTKRADIMLGGMGWTIERTKVLNMTEPIYFFGTMLTQRRATNYASVEDLKGKTIGLVRGCLLVPEFRKFPGIKEIKLYDTTDSMIRDVDTGRVDVVGLKPPSMQYLIKTYPERYLHQLPLKPHPDFPFTQLKFGVTMGLNKDNVFLLLAINREIVKMRASGKIKQIMEKYGLGDPYWFTPPPEWE